MIYLPLTSCRELAESGAATFRILLPTISGIRCREFPEFTVFRDEFFPSVVFRRCYDRLLEHHSSQRQADKEYLNILNRAALDGEIKVETALCQILLAGLIPNEELVKERAATKPASPPDITVLAPDLSIYNGLMQSRRL